MFIEYSCIGVVDIDDNIRKLTTEWVLKRKANDRYKALLCKRDIQPDATSRQLS